jgi:hypothetical protein
MDLGTRVGRTLDYFQRVHREVFAGDPASNPRLTVQVVDPAEVEGVHTLVLICPWTVNGMFFPHADQYLPEVLEIGGRQHPVFGNEIEDLGRYGSVNLVADVSCHTMSGIAASLEPVLPWFHDAVRRFYTPVEIANPDRRALLFGRRA